MNAEGVVASQANIRPIDLSIIIVTWNSARFILPCLHSLYENPVKTPFEVLVVDNDSHDESVALVRQHFPAVTLVANSINRGFAGANNQAIRRSKGQYMLLLNPDTVVFPGALDAMARFLDSHSQAAVVGPRVLSPELKVVESYCVFPGPKLLLRGSLVAITASFEKYLRKPPQQPKAVDWVGGACMMVRREPLEQVGLLDEDFFIYWEEADLCWRLAERGWQTFYLPQAEIIHHQGGSSSQAKDRIVLDGIMLEEWARSAELFVDKHYAPWTREAFRAFFGTQVLLATAFWSLVSLLWPAKRAKALATSRAYWQVLSKTLRPTALRAQLARQER